MLTRRSLLAMLPFGAVSRWLDPTKGVHTHLLTFRPTQDERLMIDFRGFARETTYATKAMMEFVEVGDLLCIKGEPGKLTVSATKETGL